MKEHVTQCNSVTRAVICFKYVRDVAHGQSTALVQSDEAQQLLVAGTVCSRRMRPADFW